MHSAVFYSNGTKKKSEDPQLHMLTIEFFASK